MGKTDVVRSLSEQLGLTQTETEKIYDSFVSILTSHLSNDTGFTLPRLGSFHSRIRESYKTYNPHYKGMIQLPKKKVVQYSQSTNVKEELSGGGL
ncbi:MAG: HU family DNA-binding protein [Balneolales bacterium]|nr:HU family DNA-binding protein [Balneolales bacterium]